MVMEVVPENTPLTTNADDPIRLRDDPITFDRERAPSKYRLDKKKNGEPKVPGLREFQPKKKGKPVDII